MDEFLAANPLFVVLDLVGTFAFAVSGGHTPWEMFHHLGSERMPWDRTAIYQVDERVAPAGERDRRTGRNRA